MGKPGRKRPSATGDAQVEAGTGSLSCIGCDSRGDGVEGAPAASVTASLYFATAAEVLAKEIYRRHSVLIQPRHDYELIVKVLEVCPNDVKWSS